MPQYSLSLILKKELSEEEVDRFKNFFSKLNSNETSNLTVSKISYATDIDHEKVAKVMLLGSQKGIFDIRYAVKCPICGHLIKSINIDEIDSAYDITECYICEEEIEVTDKDIILLFSLKNKSPFRYGQKQRELEKKAVADAQNYDSYNYFKDMVESTKLIANIMKEESERNKENERIETTVKNVRFIVHIIYIVIVFIILYFALKNIDFSENESLQNAFYFLLPLILNELIDISIERVVQWKCQK